MRTHFASRAPSAPKLLSSGYQPALHATLAGLRGFHTLMHDTPSLFGDELTRSPGARLRIAISNRLIGHGLRSGGVTIVNSEYLKAECAKDFKITAQIVRMGGLATADLPARVEHRPASRLNLLSVCRIEPNKRLDWILRSLAALEAVAISPLAEPLSGLVDWRLDLVGRGSMIGELQTLAASLGLGRRVTFHGFVSDAALEDFYANADLALTPAVQGYGIPAIEALRRHVPVLLHRESGVSDILLDTPWATVMTGGPEQLTLLLARATDDVLHARQLGVPLPRIPNEDDWARHVAQLCGWTSLVPAHPR